MKNLLLAILLLFGLVAHGQLKEERRGDAAYTSEKYLRAVSSYKEAYKLEPSYTLAKKIAESYHAGGYSKEAANWYFEILHHPNQTPVDYYKLINLLILNKEFVEAQEFIDLVVLFYPEEETKKPLYTALKNLYQYNECSPITAYSKKVNYCANLNAEGLTDNPNNNINYYWTFENGDIINGSSTRYCYKTPGIHKVKFTSVKKTLGNTTTFDTTITLNFFDDPDFEIAVANRKRPNEVNLYAYNFRNTDNFYEVVWDTGDGHLYFGESVQHKFSKKGKQTIRMYILGKSQFGEIYPIGCLKKSWTLN